MPADSNLIELLKLNLLRVESLNERIAELLEVERQALAAIRGPQATPTKGKSCTF